MFLLIFQCYEGRRDERIKVSFVSCLNYRDDGVKSLGNGMLRGSVILEGFKLEGFLRGDFCLFIMIEENFLLNIRGFQVKDYKVGKKVWCLGVVFGV